MRTVAVLAGGFSAEKEVSVRSGVNVCAALKQAGWDVCILDPAREDFSFQYLQQFDLVYPIMHGTVGEDGTLQGVLNYYGIPYVGCDLTASAMTMDKSITKKLFLALGIPCPEGFDTLGKNAEQVLATIQNYPIFVKPASEGSSVGAARFNTRAQAEAQLPQHLQKFPYCLVEQCIEGREMTTGLSWYKGQLIFLPILEIASKNEFYDYQAKYTSGMSELICPATMSEQTRARVEADCRKIYQEFGLEGVIRVDFILQQGERPCYLEINTVPGMTATSDIPAMLKTAGISLADFCSDLCLQALKKWGRL